MFSAKYPLAIVAKVMSTLAEGTLIGYDIGCGFQKTVSTSSLGAKAKERNIKFCVNAFHGYTHCYLCQLCYHPSIIQGMGLEDLEIMEHVFSASNQLVSIT